MANTRIARQSDAGTISGILAASWKSAYRGIVDDDCLDSLRTDHWTDFVTAGIEKGDIFSMLLETGGELIGAAIIGKAEKDDAAHLISFYLLPDKIGQGFGHTFYCSLEAELKKRGFAACCLDVLENNDRAVRFYEAHGFIYTGERVAVGLGAHEYTCRVYEKAID